MRIAPNRHTGFTLIELLIVVAILTTLAAIATPNFLEAQARAKVSRTHSDIKALATAIETYRIDNSKLPLVGNPAIPNKFDIYIPLDRRLTSLTTPVSYITSSPDDPFFKKGGDNFNTDDYLYAPGNLYHGGTTFTSSPYRHTIFSLSGRGPNRILDEVYCMGHPLAYQNGTAVNATYDPTNGTTSRGDVIRIGSGTLGQSG